MPKPPECLVPSLADKEPIGTLIYMELRARGEPPHLVAAYMGLRLDNARLPMREYHWMRQNSPNGLCPWLVLPDGRQIAETLDICIHIATMPSPVGRQPAPADETQRNVFEIANEPPLMHSSENPMNCAWLLNMFPWAEAKGEVAAYVRRGLKKLQRLNEELAAMNDDGEWPFFGGSTPGVGDFTLFATLDMILAISPQALVTHQLTALIEWYVTMRGLPGVSEYLAARPQLGTQSLGQPNSLMYDGYADGEAPESTPPWALGGAWSSRVVEPVASQEAVSQEAVAYGSNVDGAGSRGQQQAVGVPSFIESSFTTRVEYEAWRRSLG